MFDESTIRKVFGIIEERPAIYESFQVYLKDLLGDPKMRRAFYEYAPCLISKYDLPNTDAMRADIERLKSGREFQAKDQLKFHRSGPAATLEDFFRKLAQSTRPPDSVYELPPNEKATIVNQILMGEIPNLPLAKSLVAPLTHQLAAESPANWTAKGRAAFLSSADFRVASAMLHSSSSDKSDSRFFDLISKSDMSLDKVEFLRVRDVLQKGTLNAEEQTRLRNGLSADIGAVLRRSDFLQGGPAKARLAISLLEMADVDTPEIQSALAARKGAVSSLFFQTPRSIVSTPKIKNVGTNSLKILINDCAESYRALKRK